MNIQQKIILNNIEIINQNLIYISLSNQKIAHQKHNDEEALIQVMSDLSKLDHLVSHFTLIIFIKSNINLDQ